MLKQTNKQTISLLATWLFWLFFFWLVLDLSFFFLLDQFLHKKDLYLAPLPSPFFTTTTNDATILEIIHTITGVKGFVFFLILFFVYLSNEIFFCFFSGSTTINLEMHCCVVFFPFSNFCLLVVHRPCECKLNKTIKLLISS